MNKTLEGLLAAFVGESQARNRYSMYASSARKEGYELISAVFTETAEQEREHASWFYTMIGNVRIRLNLPDERFTVETEVPVLRKTTAENLKAAMAGETHEYTEMYPAIANQARSDGFPEIGARIDAIALAEKHHAERYGKLYAVLDNKTIFEKSDNEFWVCRQCGYVHYGKRPPESCPSCGHAKAFFQLMNETY
jgi:rubrerythrin